MVRWIGDTRENESILQPLVGKLQGESSGIGSYPPISGVWRLVFCGIRRL